MSRARAGAAALRRETGAAAVEYAGVLLLVGLIFVGLFRIGLPGEVARWAGKVVAVIDAGDTGGGTSGTAQGTGGNGQGTGGTGQGTGGRAGHGRSGQGTGGQGQGTGGQGQGTGGRHRRRTGTGGNGQGTGGKGQGTGGNGQGTGGGGSNLPCTEAADAGLCLTALGAPNAIEEKVQDRARSAVHKAADKLANSDAPPGSPEHERLKAKLNRAVDHLRESRKITEHPVIRATSPLRKFLNPRYKDLQQHANALKKVWPALANKKAPAVPTGPAAAGAPSSRALGAANKFLRGAGKFGKGLGIVGTAISGYDNIRKDGLAKGGLETLGGAASTYGASALVMTGCGIVGVATAGVGGLVCAGGAIVVGYFAGKYGKQAVGWAYDHAGEAWNFTKDKVSDGAKAAAHTAVEGGKKVLGGAKKVISSLKPGFL